MTLQEIKALNIGELPAEQKKTALIKVRTTADNMAEHLGALTTELAYQSDDEQFEEELTSIIATLREVRTVIKTLEE